MRGLLERPWSSSSSKGSLRFRWDTTNRRRITSDPTAIPNVSKVIVGEAIDKRAPLKLQLCEWHAVEAIKRRLVAAGWYKKD
jgi:hypothetical protein